MATISLCMIVKNERATLARCLSSVSAAVDEIIIADTGSTDETKQIAASFTDKVFDFKWNDNFSDARNFSFSKAGKDYIMWLDADDVILPEDLSKLIELKNNLSPDVDTVTLLYHTRFDDKGRPTFSFRRGRIVKRSRNFLWREPVHEYLETGGISISPDIAVTHAKPPSAGGSGKRNLNIYRAAVKRGEKLSPRGVYYFGRELKDHGYFSSAAKQFDKFLNEGKGWIEDNITACGELFTCHIALNKRKKAVRALYKSFEYDAPRVEICCKAGYFYKEEKDFRRASYWFLRALDSPRPVSNLGFSQPDCAGYIPCIELAVCFDKLGDVSMANFYNERAAVFKPESAAAMFNRAYFQTRLGKAKAP